MTSTTRTRRPALLAGAASLAVAAALGGVLLTQADTGTTPAPTTLALDLAGGDGAIASCMMFDVAFLKDMSPAFAGTATEVTDESVTLEVDRWYAGGDADRVVLARPDGASSAALDGVAFEQGKRYLITAAQGTVNGCGYSGLATPDLEKSFDEAFPKA